MPAALTDSSQIICEVWASNVEEEMRKIRQIIQSYNYVAMVSNRSFWKELDIGGVKGIITVITDGRVNVKNHLPMFLSNVE